MLRATCGQKARRILHPPLARKRRARQAAPLREAHRGFDEEADAVAGLAAAKRRVLGLRLRYSAAKGQYTQTLELGGV